MPEPVAFCDAAHESASQFDRTLAIDRSAVFIANDCAMNGLSVPRDFDGSFVDAPIRAELVIFPVTVPWKRVGDASFGQ